MQIAYPSELREIVERLGYSVTNWKKMFDEAVAISNMRSETIKIQCDTIDTMERRLLEITENVENTRKPEQLSERERGSMLRLIYGIVSAQYDFDPASQSSRVPKQLQDDLDTVGESMDLKTIRKYIREAFDRHWEKS